MRAYSLLTVSLLCHSLVACDSSRPYDPDPSSPSAPTSQVVIATDAGAPQQDAGAPPPVAVVDAGPGCGVSWIDGMLSTPYFTLGCTPDESSCPIDRTMTVAGRDGYPVGDYHDLCALPPSALMVTARLVLYERSRVRLTLSTEGTAEYEISIRRLCFLDKTRCAVNAGFDQLLEAGEHTLEIAVSVPTAYELKAEITPVGP